MIYLVNYVLIIYISQNRCQYFISSESIVELIVIFGVIIFPYNCEYVGVLLKSVSRMLRVNKVNVFLNERTNDEDNNVTTMAKTIVTGLIIKLMISAALYMVIENQDFDVLNDNNGRKFIPYYYHTCFYVIIITMTTVGYGDFFP